MTSGRMKDMTSQTGGAAVRNIVLGMAPDKSRMDGDLDALLLRDELCFDSLTLATLMFRIHEDLGVSLLQIQRHLVAARTVGDLVRGIESSTLGPVNAQAAVP